MKLVASEQNVIGQAVNELLQVTNEFGVEPLVSVGIIVESMDASVFWFAGMFVFCLFALEDTGVDNKLEGIAIKSLSLEVCSVFPLFIATLHISCWTVGRLGLYNDELLFCFDDRTLAELLTTTGHSLLSRTEEFVEVRHDWLLELDCVVVRLGIERLSDKYVDCKDNGIEIGMTWLSVTEEGDNVGVCDDDDRETGRVCDTIPVVLSKNNARTVWSLDDKVELEMFRLLFEEEMPWISFKADW